MELFFRVTGTKDTFADEEKCAEYIEERREAEAYTLDVKLSSDVSESVVNGNTVYRRGHESCLPDIPDPGGKRRL